MVPSAKSSSISRADEVGQQLAGLVEHARDVRQHHQLLGLEHLGQLAGHDVGVDVVVLVVRAEAQRRDDGDELVVLQRLDHRGVDGLDLADLAHVVHDVVGSLWSTMRSLRARIRPPSRPVRPTALPPATLIRPTMSCCTWPASTHSTTSIVSSSVTRMPWMKVPFLPIFGEGVLDLRAAAVHHHRVHADELEQHHVFREVLLQRRIGHRIAAVLDHDGLAVELADVGQGLGQDLGLVAGGDVGQDRGQRGARGSWQGLSGNGECGKL